MKYAIISDIHGNMPAFKAALADAKKRGCGSVICLGDLTGYGNDSAGCVKLAMRRVNMCLMGNHDSACCGREDPVEVQSILNHYETDVQARETLTEDEMAWLRVRPYVCKGPGFACTHGEFSSPQEWGYITRPSDAWKSLWSRNEPLLFIGHSHIPVIMKMPPESVHKSKSFDEEEAMEGMRGLKVVKARSCVLTLGARYVVNVGSVGRPRAGSKPIYAIYDSTEKRVVLASLAILNGTCEPPMRLGKELS